MKQVITLEADVTPIRLMGNNMVEVALDINSALFPSDVMLEVTVPQRILITVEETGLYPRRYGPSSDYPAEWGQGPATITIELHGDET